MLTPCPDPEHLEKFVTTSFAELLKSSRRVVKPAVEEEPTPPKRKRPSGTIPFTAKKDGQSFAKGATASSPGKAGTTTKPVKRVSAVIGEVGAQPISDSRTPENIPATRAEQESAKTLAAAGD